MQFFTRSEVVLSWLRENNFTKIKGHLPSTLEFAEDEHCPDVYVFNTADRAIIMESQIVRDRYLIIQVTSFPLFVNLIPFMIKEIGHDNQYSV